MLKECGARAKTKDYKPCRQYALLNGRCRFHGGESTGAKTPEGRRKLKEVNIKHGFYTAEAIAERRAARTLIKEFKLHI